IINRVRKIYTNSDDIKVLAITGITPTLSIEKGKALKLANVYTLQDISSNKGYHLGSMHEQELEETLHHSLKSISELNICNESLQARYLKQTKQLKIENTNLTFENICKDISLLKSKAENITKSKKIKSLESIIKILKTNKDNMLDISIKPDIALIIFENVNLCLAQLENYASSLIESNFQMRPGLKALLF
ncbi:8461_t:CDS:2, partial [Cetraspora pellucida]